MNSQNNSLRWETRAWIQSKSHREAQVILPSLRDRDWTHTLINLQQNESSDDSIHLSAVSWSTLTPLNPRHTLTGKVAAETCRNGTGVRQSSAGKVSYTTRRCLVSSGEYTQNSPIRQKSHENNGDHRSDPTDLSIRSHDTDTIHSPVIFVLS